MQWYHILIIVFVSSIIISLFVSVSIFMAYNITHPHHFGRDEVKNRWEKYKVDEIDEKIKRTDIEFKMKDGYIIHGDYVLANNSNKFVICVHGFSTNREAEMPYGFIFYHLGHNVLVYDQRGHGDNEAALTKMGIDEASDLDEIINQLKLKFGNDIEIGLHGVSMGASTCLMLTRIRQDIKFIVDDCGFVRFSNVIIKQLNKRHFPGVIFMPFVSFTCKIMYGFSLKDASIEKYIGDINVPTLIFHGSNDSFVPVFNSNLLNDKLKCKHKLVVYNCEHADCMRFNKEEYRREIEEFLKGIE